MMQGRQVRAVRRSMGREEGFIGRFLIITLLSFVILALAANEVGQIVVAKVHSSNAATAAAEAGAASYHATRSRSQARMQAQQAAAEAGGDARITAFSVASDGSVTVIVATTAHTLIVRRVSFLRRFGIQRSSHAAPPPP